MTVPAPAHAADPYCTFDGPFAFQTLFDGGKEGSYTTEVDMTGRSGQPAFTAHLFDMPVLGPEIRGTLNANIDGRRLHMIATWESGDTFVYDGEISDAGLVKNRKVRKEKDAVPMSWNSSTPLKCVDLSILQGLGRGNDEEPTGTGTAIKADSPPDVDIDVSQLGTVKVTVHDNSSVASPCTYSATPRPPTLLTPTTKKFDLPADGTYSWDYPAIKTFTTFDVVVDCGGKRKTTKEVQY